LLIRATTEESARKRKELKLSVGAFWPGIKNPGDFLRSEEVAEAGEDGLVGPGEDSPAKIPSRKSPSSSTKTCRALSIDHDLKRLRKLCPSSNEPLTEATLGVFHDGAFTGKGTSTVRGGKANGQISIHWTASPDGDGFVGEVRNGKLDGQITVTRNGIKQVGESHGSLGRVEKAALTYASGETYLGGFREGKPDGQGTVSYANGDKYVGVFHDGAFSGKGSLTYIGEFRDGKYIPQASFEVRLQRRGGVLLVPVLINDKIPLDFIIDSGAADVSVPADVVLTLMRTGTLAEADFTGAQTYVLADGSKVPSQTFRIRSLKVGERVLTDVSGSVASVNGSLLLGQSFLSRFKSWSIDNARQVLVLDVGDLRDGIVAGLSSPGRTSPSSPSSVTSSDVRKSPGFIILGQSAPTESFNSFRFRALSSVVALMSKLAESPKYPLAVSVPSEVIKLVNAWVAKGLPDDLSVDPKALTAAESPMPGEVKRFWSDTNGNWIMSKFDPEKESTLPGGSIYFIEYGPNLLDTDLLGAKGKAEAQSNLGEAFREAETAMLKFGGPSAQFDLGVGYAYDSGLGVRQDRAEAVRWFRTAAEQGNAEAQYNLGVMYGNGFGVPQDYVQAYMWFTLATASGEARAVSARAYLASVMTPQHIAEAQQLAREWKPKSPH